MGIIEMEEVKGAINEVLEQSKYNGGGIDEIKSNALLSAGSVVKSVQRGYVSSLNISMNAPLTIPISEIDAGKSVLLYTVGNTTNVNVGYSLTNIAIVLTSYAGLNISGSAFSWQIIEFY